MIARASDLLTPSQKASRRRKEARRLGLETTRRLNREQDVREKEAADLRRAARAVPGTDRAPALARAFREVQAAKAAA